MSHWATGLTLCLMRRAVYVVSGSLCQMGPGLVGRMKVPCTACDGEGTRLRDKEK